MQIISTIAAMREHLRDLRRAGRSIGLVPTMGYLHDGHMALVKRARADNDVVVTSIFVNPLQFGKNEDLSKYPRDMARDSAMLEAGGVDFVFAPGIADMYPRPMETVVDVPSLGSMLEGEVRPGHFAGVATVVTKLFNIVQPDRAYFGEKDFQQLQIIRRMVEDLTRPKTLSVAEDRRPFVRSTAVRQPVPGCPRRVHARLVTQPVLRPKAPGHTDRGLFLLKYPQSCAVSRGATPSPDQVI